VAKLSFGLAEVDLSRASIDLTRTKIFTREKVDDIRSVIFATILAMF